MTILGLLLVFVGLLVGLTSPIAYNGQWLLGVVIAVAGVVLVIRQTTKEKK